MGADRHRGMWTEGQTVRAKTDRQRDKQSGRHTDGGRKTATDRERDKDTDIHYKHVGALKEPTYMYILPQW